MHTCPAPYKLAEFLWRDMGPRVIQQRCTQNSCLSAFPMNDKLCSMSARNTGDVEVSF